MAKITICTDAGIVMDVIENISEETLTPAGKSSINCDIWVAVQSAIDYENEYSNTDLFGNSPDDE